MIQQGHLQVWELKLTARSPVFAGDGTCSQQTEYIWLREHNRVLFLDEERFIRTLEEKGLIEAYEGFVLGKHRDLYRFLTEDCHFSESDLFAVASRAVRGDGLEENGTDGALREIHTFCRDGRRRAYIPGSSVKGALRTVLLTAHILNDPNRGEHPFSEERYLHTLRQKLDRDGNIQKKNVVNSILRGVSVSDSLPIEDSAMILCGKHDVGADGCESVVPLLRECIAPGTEVVFRLTLDKSIVKDAITAEQILKDIRQWDRYYLDTYMPHFASPEQSAAPALENCLILGGGAGYFSKTVTYPYYGAEAVRQTAEMMKQKFDQHQHNLDADLGIYPRTMKYTWYQGCLYPYGFCEVSLT